MKLDVLVAGEIYADLIMAGFDFFPAPGQEAFAREFRREVGGGVAITACGLATLGTSAGLFAVTGADHHGWISERLAAKGVDVSLLHIQPQEPTGFTVAVTAPEDRAYITYAGANRAFAAALDYAPFESVRHVHLGWAPPWEIAPDLFERIHAAGASVSVDAGWHEDWLADARSLPYLSNADIFFPNETEAARMTGHQDPTGMLACFARAGLRGVALKLGARGSCLLWHGRTFHAPPLPVTPIDTTGAGDCFDAGFLHAWLRGESPERCLAVANICGALSTEAYGGIEGFPSRARLQQVLEK